MPVMCLMPWGKTRPAREPFLSYPGVQLVEADERGRVIGPVKEAKKRTRRTTKKSASGPPSPVVDNIDLGDLDELDDS